MNRKELTKRYWRYYLMLEKRFIGSIEYVALDKKNYPTFSNEYALLIQAIGAELDTVFKVFCGFNTEDRQKTITDYAEYILIHKKEITNQEITLKEYDLKIQPFQNWDEKKAKQSLPWWEAFVNIKHNRYLKQSQANQENILNILGALYLIEMMHLKKITENTNDIDRFDEDSQLFTLEDWSFNAIPLDQAFAFFD